MSRTRSIMIRARLQAGARLRRVPKHGLPPEIWRALGDRCRPYLSSIGDDSDRIAKTWCEIRATARTNGEALARLVLEALAVRYERTASTIAKSPRFDRHDHASVAAYRLRAADMRRGIRVLNGECTNEAIDD